MRKSIIFLLIFITCKLALNMIIKDKRYPDIAPIMKYIKYKIYKQLKLKISFPSQIVNY